GLVKVCVDYSGTQFGGVGQLALFHQESSIWVDRTVSRDAVNKSICGSVTSLSPFGVFQQASPASPPTTAVSASPSPSAAGWNNTSVVVQLNSTANAGAQVQGISYTLSAA